MYKIAVIGGGEIAAGFRALGLDVFPVTDREQALEAFRAAAGADKSYAVIYIEERFAAALSSETARYGDSPAPAVVLIPGPEGIEGQNLSALKESAD